MWHMHACVHGFIMCAEEAPLWTPLTGPRGRPYWRETLCPALNSWKQTAWGPTDPRGQEGDTEQKTCGNWEFTDPVWDTAALTQALNLPGRALPPRSDPQPSRHRGGDRTRTGPWPSVRTTSGRSFRPVLPRGQLQPARHLPRAGMGAAARRGLAAQEEVLAQRCVMRF